MNRSEAIAAHIARSIMRNSNRRFSTLHADAIEETKMSDTTNNMNVGSQVNVGPIKPSHGGEPCLKAVIGLPVPRFVR
jgi:hypothetical protein